MKSNLNNLRPFAVRHWKKGAVGGLLVLFASLLAFPQPLIFRYLIDKVILDRQGDLLIWAILLLVGIAAAEKLAHLWQDFYFARFEQEVILDLQSHLLDKVLRLPQTFFDEQKPGYLVSRVTSDVQQLRWFFSSTTVQVLSNSIRLIGGAIFLFYLEWRLAGIVLVVLPVGLWTLVYLSKKLHVLSHQNMEMEGQVLSRFQESLSSISLIKAFAAETRTAGRLVRELKKALQISLEQSTIHSLADLMMHSLPGIARAVLLICGGFWVINSHWTLGSLLAFQLYLGYLFGPMQFLATANLQLQNARAALQRVSTLLALPPEENLGEGKIIEKLKGGIEFQNVTFSHDSREPVLRQISFRIEPGERVGIVGPSGIGKTTLLCLLLRFYRPTSGEIYFDGEPASVFETGSLRRRIGYVSQNSAILSGTIRENLSYGRKDATDEEITQAARAAGLHNFITGLSGGYQTLLGERGINLSEGQRQRLSLARALIKDPDILILDEPTSALDRLTEQSIFQSLPLLVRGKTMLVVAHRLSTLQDSDRLLVLDENGLLTTGTHTFLLQTHPYYRSLWNGKDKNIWGKDLNFSRQAKGIYEFPIA